MLKTHNLSNIFHRQRTNPILRWHYWLLKDISVIALTTEWSAYKGEKCRGYSYYLSKPLLPHCQPPPPNRSRGPLRSPVTWPMLARRRVTGQVGVWREEGPLTISPPWENSVSGRTVDTNSWVLGAWGVKVGYQGMGCGTETCSRVLCGPGATEHRPSRSLQQPRSVCVCQRVYDKNISLVITLTFCK